MMPIRIMTRCAADRQFDRHSMRFRAFLIFLIVSSLSACVYRIDVQQGNLLDDEDIGQVEVGMTRSQVQFLLGTPMIADSFHRDRWDYAYYFRRGRSEDIIQRWVVVYFEDDRVARVDRDLALQPPTS